MKKFAALAVAMAACSLYAYEAEKVGDYTYTNSVIRGKAIIGNGFNTAITPEPTGALTIPDTLGGAPVGTINDWAFNGCENLMDVIVPDSVETIGSCAFSSCPKLANVTLGVSVKTVSKNAFQNSGFQSDGTYQLEKVVFRGAKPEGAEAVIGAAKEVQYRKKYESQYSTAVPAGKKGAYVALDTPEDQALASDETEFDEAEKRTETSEGALKLKGKELGGATKVVSTFTYTTPSGKGTLDFWWKASTVLPDSANVATNGTAVATVPSIGGVTDWTHGKIILAADAPVTVTWNYEKTVSDTSGTEDCIWVDGIEWTETPDAATEDVDGLTWTYLIVGDTACIGDGAPGAVTPAPSGALTIPAMLGGKPVTAINQCALSGLTGITGVTIPDSVTELGVHAFEGCTALDTVTLGDGVEIIDAGAFDGCTGITTVTIPQGVCNTTLAEVFPDAYATKIGTVTISDAVTSLGEDLFAGCTGLASVTIPANVTAIGDGAFDGCTGLMTVTLGDGLEEIGDDAFKGCTVLDTVNLGDGLEKIGDDVFKGCTVIKTVTIPQLVCSSTLAEVFPDAYAGVSTINISAKVESIGENAFTNCTGLTSVVIPASVKAIGAKAFIGTGLTKVTIPGNVTEVGESAFEGCTTLIELILNEGVEKIGTNAFKGCTGLTSVVIPASVTEIGEGAFNGCVGIDSVTIASGATTIGKGAFAGCTTIKHVAIPNTVTEIGEGAFDGCTALNSVTFGSAVETIGEKAFEGCTALTSVTVPASVKTIGTEAFKGCTILANVTLNEGLETIGDNAFEGCAAITGIEIPASVTAVGAGAFAWCGNLEGVLLREGLEELGEGAFTNCVKLLSITVPDSVTAIGAGAFADCVKLGEAILGAGITEIPDNAFNGCTVLESITVPDGVTAIGVSAFEGCTALATVDLGLGVVTLGDNAFKDCTTLTGISVPDSTETIGKSAFEGCTGLATVTLGDGLVTVDDRAFYGCTALTSVIVPDSVVTIGDEAFKDCGALLTTVTLGDGLEDLGDDAFKGCTGITTVTIPQLVCSSTLAEVFPDAYTGITKVTISDNISYLNGSPFGGCGNITDVTIPQVVCSSTLAEVFPTYGTITTVTISEVVSSIGDNAFKGCEKLTSVKIPDGVTKVGESAFEGCSALASVTIGSGVPSIGAKAFKGCTMLTSVTIPDGVTAIGASAFEDCTALAAVTIGEGVRSIGTDAFKGINSGSVVKFYGNKPEGADALIIQLSADGNKVSYRRKYESEYGLDGAPVFNGYIEMTLEDELLKYANTEYDTTEKRTETSKGSIKIKGKGNGTTAKASYKVGGRGTLTFWWKASTEYNPKTGVVCDYGYVSCEDTELSGDEGSTEVKNIGGNTGWTQATWVNNTGAKYVTWNYKKDTYDDVMTGIDDCIWIDGIEWTPDLRQDALGVDVPLEFEDNDNPNWEVVDGGVGHSTALRSGPIGHNESNWVQITVKGPGTISFKWKVSSETVREEAYDGAEFLINGTAQVLSNGEKLLGGAIDWTAESFTIDEGGTYKLTWAYSKDASDVGNIRDDCMWLDDVSWSGTVLLTTAAAPKLLSAGTTRALLAVSSDVDAQAAVSGFDFADGSVAENVDTAAEYNALGNWAKANDLGRQELRTSGTVYDSFTLDADGLIEEIAISEMEGAAGELTVKVQVSDANGDAVAVAGEKVAQMVQVSGVLGDWQEPEQVEYVGEEDGKLVFKVTTGIEGDGVFVRIKQ